MKNKDKRIKELEEENVAAVKLKWIMVFGLIILLGFGIYYTYKVENLVQQLQLYQEKITPTSYSFWVEEETSYWRTTEPKERLNRFNHYAVAKFEILKFYKNGVEIDIDCEFNGVMVSGRAITHEEAIKLYLCGVLK